MLTAVLCPAYRGSVIAMPPFVCCSRQRINCVARKPYTLCASTLYRSSSAGRGKRANLQNVVIESDFATAIYLPSCPGDQLDCGRMHAPTAFCGNALLSPLVFTILLARRKRWNHQLRSCRVDCGNCWIASTDGECRSTRGTS